MMPAQTTAIGVAYYSELDTAPPLRRQLIDADGTPFDLSDAATVTIRIAHTTYDHYYSPYPPIIESGSCVIEMGTQGWVHWLPGVGELAPPGNYDYAFTITWNDGTVQTVPAHTYERLIIKTKPGGQVAP
jgi:hypothetical protein